MQGRKAQMDEISEILRCYKITGAIKDTARTLKYAKGTVRKYVRWAKGRGYLDSEELPSEARLAKEFKRYRKEGVIQATLEPHREKIDGWLEQGITVVRMYDLLGEGYGFKGSYETVKRFTLPLRKDKKACVRLEVLPGKEAQVDFGSMGMMWDPVEKRKRKAWLFLMTLSHSRHAYGEFVFRQDIETWIGCHRRAFEWFGGVPEKIVIDNLKAAIVKAAIYDPVVNRTYRESAVHYGFIISPCKPYTPEHKGKVERGIPFVRKRFVAGSNFVDINDANAKLLEWLVGNAAGLRIHGTTKQQPLVVFEMVEKDKLKRLPVSAYHMSIWKEAKLHKDCHVAVEGSYYSAPHHLRGSELLVKLTDTMTYIYYDYQLVAVHLRAHQKGTWRTINTHYPPEKRAFLEATPQWCLKKAKGIGENTFSLVHELLLESHPLDNLRKVQGIVGLSPRYPRSRMEAAAKRALYFGALTYRAFKNILEKGLDREPLDDRSPPAAHSQEKLSACRSLDAGRPYAYQRPITDFVAADEKGGYQESGQVEFVACKANVGRAENPKTEKEEVPWN